MLKLTPEQKLHLTMGLACWETPTSLAAEMKEIYGQEVSLAAVLAYDPTKAQGKRLSADLQKAFAETRKRFIETETDVAIANRSWRLARLEKLLDAPSVARNPKMTLAILEQAAKESGKMYERPDPALRSALPNQGPGSDAKSELLGEMTDDELDRRIAEAEARKAAETVPEGS